MSCWLLLGCWLVSGVVIPVVENIKCLEMSKGTFLRFAGKSRSGLSGYGGGPVGSPSIQVLPRKDSAWSANAKMVPLGGPVGCSGAKLHPLGGPVISSGD